MNILGIDYGDRKVGLARASGTLAEPLAVIKLDNWDRFVERLMAIIAEEKTEKIIIGLSEGRTAEKTKDFGQKLQSRTIIPIEYVDETLSTQEAQILSREGGMKRKKRLALEDAFSATVILQNYLDFSSHKSD